MARKDWMNVGISSFNVQAIDSYLKSDAAKITKIESRQHFVNKLIIEFFAKYMQRTGVNHFPPWVESKQKPPPDLLDFGHKKTKKQTYKPKTITQGS